MKKLIKGSKQAKDFMAKIRAKRKKTIKTKHTKIGSLLKKAKIAGLPIGFRGSWRGQSFYIVNQYDFYNNVVCEFTDSKTHKIFAVVNSNSNVDMVIDEIILWLQRNGVDFTRGLNSVFDGEKELKQLHRDIKKFVVELIKEIKAYNKKAHKTPGKKPSLKKTPVKKIKVERLRPTKVAKKTTILKESHLLKNKLHDKGLIMPHGYQIKRSKHSVISGINKHNIDELKNTKFLLDMYTEQLIDLVKNPKQSPFDTLPKKWYNDSIKMLKKNISQKKRHLAQLKKLI
jgi:hypothetical protein